MRTSLCALLTFVALSLAGNAAAQVVGVDFGSQFFKVALVKPGSPFQIVHNFQSKRKTPSSITFYQDERMYGADSLSLATRKPHVSLHGFQRLLGKNLSHPVVQEHLARYPNELYEDSERHTLRVRMAGKENSEPLDYSVEEVVSMLLKHVRDISAAEAGSAVKDMVITVPSFATQAERRALLDAAELAGANVLALVDEMVAAAVQYGIDHVHENGTFRVLFYNMGGHATQALLAEYGARKTRHLGHELTVATFSVAAQAADPALGGVHFDDAIVHELARRFNAQRHAKGAPAEFDVRSHPRSMARLRGAASKLKEILSANDAMPITVEGLYDEMDFHTEVTRAELEEAAHPLLLRAMGPVREVLARAGITAEQLDEVEIVGGSVRVPAVQALLKEELGRTELSVHLNGDEAMALGAAFRAANISKAFRVRPMFMHEPVRFGLRATLTGPAEEGAQGEEGEGAVAEGMWEKSTVLFGPRDGAGKRRLSLSRTKDFTLTLTHEDTEALPAGASPLVKRVQVTGLAEATEPFLHLNATPKVALSVAVDRRGLIDVARTSVIVEEWVAPEPEAEPAPAAAAESSEDAAEAESEAGANAGATGGEAESADGSADADGAAAEEAGKEEATEGEGTATEGAEPEGSSEGPTAEGDGDATEGAGADAGADTDAEAEAGQEGESVERDGPSGKAEAGAEATPAPKAKAAPKPRLKKHVLKVGVADATEEAPVRPMGADALKASKTSLAALDRRDEERRAREAARSNLEAFLFSTRDGLFDDEEAAEAVSTEEQRDEVRALLEAVEDWLYDEGESAGLAAYDAKRKEVVDLVAPLQLRLRERTARPAAVKAATQVAVKARQTAAEWRKERPWLTEEQLTDLDARAQELAAWLKDQLEAQEAKAGHEEPAFTSADVAQQVDKVRSLVKRLRKVPKPEPPKENVTVTGSRVETQAEAEAEAGETQAEAAETQAEASEAEAAGTSEGEGEAEAETETETAEGEEVDTEAQGAGEGEEGAATASAEGEEGDIDAEPKEGDVRKDEL